jgi:RimJ/RimL family protein N-acetyltransferase
MIKPWTAPLSGPSQAMAQRIAALVPVLTTPRLTLRAPLLDDFGAWFAIVGGDRAEYIGGALDEDEAWAEFCTNTANWMLRGHGMWTINGPGSQVVGFALLGFEPGDQEHELGYLMCVSGEGQGFATEAAAAARDYAVQVLGLPSLVSYVAHENHRSAAVAERLGAIRDGVIDGCDIWRHHPKERVLR